MQDKIFKVTHKFMKLFPLEILRLYGINFLIELRLLANSCWSNCAGETDEGCTGWVEERSGQEATRNVRGRSTRNIRSTHWPGRVSSLLSDLCCVLSCHHLCLLWLPPVCKLSYFLCVCYGYSTSWYCCQHSDPVTILRMVCCMIPTIYGFSHFNCMDSCIYVYNHYPVMCDIVCYHYRIHVCRPCCMIY